jgi:riboflavin kinase/FMN adenylyltransferase
MRIFRHYSELPAELRGGVAVLGNFDGVHRGHQAAIAEARRLAKAERIPMGVMTFEPHPRQVFRPNDPPFRLTPMRVKARQIEALGADFLILQRFDMEFSRKEAPDFVAEVLVRALNARHVVVGFNYVFGRNRGGNVDVLRRLAAEHGFGITTLDAARGPDGEIFSSTRIREFLVNGAVQDAARILGRPWEIEGRVQQGDQRGRTIGFPTANIALGEYLRPALGVYAVRAGIDLGMSTEWRPGVANLGRRPTFGKLDELLEVHLFDFQGDLYNRHLRVALVDFLRPERKFDGLAALTAQIAEDAAKARNILADDKSFEQ